MKNDDITDWRSRQFLSIGDMAAILNISRDTARCILQQMPYVKIGRSYRVAGPAFEKWLRDKERLSVR